jgi:hypothetical protein
MEDVSHYSSMAEGVIVNHAPGFVMALITLVGLCCLHGRH